MCIRDRRSTRWVARRGFHLCCLSWNFNREFFRYEEPCSLKEIDKELAAVERRILDMLNEVTE